MDVNTPKLFLREKRNFIIYLGLLIFLVAVFLIWHFYFRLDDSRLHSIETKIQNNKEINKYFSAMSFSRNEQQQVISFNAGSAYPYKLVGSLNKDFSQLSDNEKVNALTKLKDFIEANGSHLLNCGYNKYCTTTEIDVVNSDTSKIDIYSFDTVIGDITHSYDDQNGVHQTETISSTDSSSNSDSTSSNTSTNNSSVTDTTPQTQTTPQIGMTAEEVRATKWGKPAEINKTTTAVGESEQWVYYNNGVPDRYVYLDNGIVTAVQQSN